MDSSVKLDPRKVHAEIWIFSSVRRKISKYIIQKNPVQIYFNWTIAKASN